MDNESDLQSVHLLKHSKCMLDAFRNFRLHETLLDVTLACNGQSMKAHKLVLSACSTFFEELFSANPCTHPIIILRDFDFVDLRAVIDFMYKGELSVPQERFMSALKVAEELHVRGLRCSESAAKNNEKHRNQVIGKTPSRKKQKRHRHNSAVSDNRGKVRISKTDENIIDSRKSVGDSAEPRGMESQAMDVENLNKNLLNDQDSTAKKNEKHRKVIGKPPSTKKQKRHCHSSAVSDKRGKVHISKADENIIDSHRSVGDSAEPRGMESQAMNVENLNKNLLNDQESTVKKNEKHRNQVIGKLPSRKKQKSHHHNSAVSDKRGKVHISKADGNINSHRSVGDSAEPRGKESQAMNVKNLNKNLLNDQESQSFLSRAKSNSKDDECPIPHIAKPGTSNKDFLKENLTNEVVIKVENVSDDDLLKENVSHEVVVKVENVESDDDLLTENVTHEVVVKVENVESDDNLLTENVAHEVVVKVENVEFGDNLLTENVSHEVVVNVENVESDDNLLTENVAHEVVVKVENLDSVSENIESNSFIEPFIDCSENPRIWQDSVPKQEPTDDQADQGTISFDSAACSGEQASSNASSLCLPPKSLDRNCSHDPKIDKGGDSKRKNPEWNFGGWHICPHCPYAAERTTDIRNHLVVHTGERPFHCSICESKFSRKHSLKRHIIKYHEFTVTSYPK